MLLAMLFTVGYLVGGICALVIIALTIASQRGDDMDIRLSLSGGHGEAEGLTLTPGASSSEGDAL